MSIESSDRNLLFAVLALQNNFISQDEMLGAFRELTRSKLAGSGSDSGSNSMRDLLLERGAINKSSAKALDLLVEAHLEKHDFDSKASLQAADNLDSSLHQSLQEIDPTIDSNLNRESHILPTFGLTLSASVGASTTNGRFQILRPYAKGGLGEVFVARDQELDREVALKQIRGESSQIEKRERFVREAEITGKLEHPGIVPIYGLGANSDGSPYYAMRFIRGQSLRDAIKSFHKEDNNSNRSSSTRNKQLRKLLSWFIDVCYAISYAHSRGVLHRDIKPSNVMIGKFGETLVVDWGMARVSGVDDHLDSASDEKPLKSTLSGLSSHTLDGQAMGTPAYMSPEQASGRLDQHGPQSDVYCLGATLFAIVTGKAPHQGNPDTVLKRVGLGDFPKPTEVNEAVPKALEAICLKAMALQPSERYQSAIDLAHDVEAWLADEPFEAWNEPFSYRVRRWVQRHQTPVIGASIGIIALAGAATIASVLLSAKNTELSEASDTIQAKNIALTTANENETNARQRADRVKDYLVDIFQRTDPTEDGRALTLAQLLDASVQKIEQDLAGDPLTQADLYASIGQSYVGLGLYEEGRQAYLKELEIRETNQPADDVQVLRSRYHVADALWRLSDYPEAVEQVSLTLKKQQETLGKKNADTLNSMNMLALCYQVQGKATLATEIFEEVVELRKELHGPDASATLLAINNLATAYNRATRYNDAQVLFESNLQKQRAVHGEDHSETTRAKYFIAGNLRALGRFDEAVKFFNEVVEKRKSQLGESHPSTLEAINSLVLALQDQGQYEQTVPLIKTVLEKQKERLGDNHNSTLRAMNTLGMALVRVGRISDAIPVFEEALPAFEKKYGADNPSTNSVVNNLAYSYLSRGDYAKSIPLFQRAYESRLADLGPRNDKTILTYNNWALAIEGNGELEKSLSMLKKSYEQWKEKDGANNHNTLSSARMLGTSLRRAGYLDESKQILQQTRASQIEALSEEHPNTLYTNSSLAATLSKLGETDEAIGLIEQTIEKMETKFGEQHPQTLSARRLLGACWIEADQSKKAIDLLTDVLEAMRVKRGPDHPATLKTMGALGLAYANQGNHDEAVRFFEQAIDRQLEQLGERHPACLTTRLDFAAYLLQQAAWESARTQLDELWRVLPTQADHNLLPVEIQNRKTVIGMYIELFKKTGNDSALKQWQAKQDQIDE